MKEDLMKDRFIVEQPDTSGRWAVGDIWTFEREVAQTYDQWTNQKGKTVTFNFFMSFPHLFRKLYWWEHRKFSELPEYIRWHANGLSSVFKVENWYSNPNTGEYAGVYVDGSNRLFIKDCEPATESEYQSSLTPNQER